MPETSPDKEKLPGGAEIVVRDSENGRAVSASIDDVVRIELSENPTTGFRWQLSSIDAGVLSLQSDVFTPASGAAVGGGGFHVFRFVAGGRGSCHVQFELRRSWESGLASSTFAIRVSVA